MRVRLSLDRAALGRITDAAAAGLGDAAEFLLEQANRSVPLDEATLEGSGSVDVDAGAMEAAVSYDTPYAVRQHEDLTLRHPNGRKAKWLEDTFKEDGPRAMNRVGDRIRRVTA